MNARGKEHFYDVAEDLAIDDGRMPIEYVKETAAFSAVCISFLWKRMMKAKHWLNIGKAPDGKILTMTNR